MQNLKNMHNTEDTSSWDGSPFPCKRSKRKDCMSLWSSQLKPYLFKICILYHKHRFMHMMLLWRWLISWVLYVMPGRKMYAVIIYEPCYYITYTCSLSTSLPSWRLMALWDISIGIHWYRQTNKQDCAASQDLRKGLWQRPNDGMRLCWSILWLKQNDSPRGTFLFTFVPLSILKSSISFLQASVNFLPSTLPLFSSSSCFDKHSEIRPSPGLTSIQKLSISPAQSPAIALDHFNHAFEKLRLKLRKVILIDYTMCG